MTAIQKWPHSYRVNDEYHRGQLSLAYGLAASSPDQSNQNGAIIVDGYNEQIAEGYNRICPDLNTTSERMERPLKYAYTEHAERAAVYQLASSPLVAGLGAKMICPWVACPDCARAIIESGILSVVTHQERIKKTPDRWSESVQLGLSMLLESGITVLFFSGEIRDCPPVIVNGKRWQP